MTEKPKLTKKDQELIKLKKENDELKAKEVRLQQSRNKAMKKWYNKRYNEDAEFREKQKAYRREYTKRKYEESPEYREKVNGQRMAYYYRQKAKKEAEKAQTILTPQDKVMDSQMNEKVVGVSDHVLVEVEKDDF